MSKISPEKIAEALIELLAAHRKAKPMTLEEVADKAGVHRTTIGLLERKERSPTIDSALRIADAMDLDLAELLAQARAIAGGKAPKASTSVARRLVKEEHFRNPEILLRQTGLIPKSLKLAIETCYHTLDTIDFELTAHDSPPIANLVELANLSSMIGNLLGGAIALHSNGLYIRNRPHTYPDLLPVAPNTRTIELKMALESNSPKGHLAKAGNYLAFRYVLANKQGDYARGKTNRGDTAFVWEARVGHLSLEDFSISNTAGDSGKTAVIKTAALNAMAVVYYVPSLLPYANARVGH